jgi:hypothetical protein
MSADLEQPIHQPPAADASADSGKASPAISPAGSPDFDIVTGDTPVSRSARCTARRKAAAAIAVVVTAVLALLVFVVYSGSSAAHAGEALFTVPMTTNVVLVGGVCTGSFTTTMYIGAGCAVPETECGPDDVNLPADGSACARGDVTNVTRTVEWTRGECVAWPGSSPGVLGPADALELLQAAGHLAVGPAYMKVEWAGGVATIEHFSDAACTAANKISAEDIHAAIADFARSQIVAEYDDIGLPEMADCVTASATGIAGVSVTPAEPVCGGVALTIDRVRHCHTPDASV